MRRKDREVSDQNIIREILTRADVCRLAFVDDDIPYIVALNFGVEFNDPLKLYFHSAPKGRKIELAEKSSHAKKPVCFQLDVDHNLRPADVACDWSMNYKSIVGYGKIRFLENVAEKQNALDLIMDHYNPVKQGHYEYSEKDLKATTLLELVVDSLSCKMRDL